MGLYSIPLKHQMYVTPISTIEISNECDAHDYLQLKYQMNVASLQVFNIKMPNDRGAYDVLQLIILYECDVYENMYLPLK